MTKRRSNFLLISRGGLLIFLVVTAAMAGCKKESPPPAPEVKPLPKKTQPGAPAGPAVPAKPVQTVNTSARKPADNKPVQGQQSTAKPQLVPGGVHIDFTGKRDPFRPYVNLPSSQQGDAGSSKKGRVRDPLPIQRYDTDKFKVTGIISGMKENSALIIDPVGKGYVVKAGMLMGNNDGIVRKVTNSTVEVEETFTDDNGKVRKRLVKLMLTRKK